MALLVRVVDRLAEGPSWVAVLAFVGVVLAFTGAITAAAFGIAVWVDELTPPCPPSSLTVYDLAGFKAGCAVPGGES